MKTEADVLVVGGGIVGLATARALQLRKPGAHVVVIDKEADIARHQTGNNSGVIHAGVYYKPGSYKARLCFDGRVRLVEYLQDKGIPHRIDGKLVVATNADEVDKMKEIQRRCEANDVPTQWMTREEFREVEPHAEGVAALQVKVTGVVDYKAVCQSYADDIRAAGGEIRTGTALVSGRPGLNDVTVETTQGTIVAKQTSSPAPWAPAPRPASSGSAASTTSSRPRSPTCATRSSIPSRTRASRSSGCTPPRASTGTSTSGPTPSSRWLERATPGPRSTPRTWPSSRPSRGSGASRRSTGSTPSARSSGPSPRRPSSRRRRR